MDFTGRGTGAAVSGSEPIIRTVGSNVVGSEPQEAEPETAGDTSGMVGSPSPVIIPPPLTVRPFRLAHRASRL